MTTFGQKLKQKNLNKVTKKWQKMPQIGWKITKKSQKHDKNDTKMTKKCTKKYKKITI